MIKLKEIIEKQKILEEKSPKKDEIVDNNEKCDLITRLRERKECEDC